MVLFDLNIFDFWYVVCMLFVIGACIGSFLNVVILRAFTEESIVLPPSKCPKCHNKLKWYHNIPILSYIFLRGKCGFCHEKISIQYPIVEFVFALFFTSIFLKFGVTVNALFLTIIGALSLVLTVTDIKEQVIFDTHAYILGAVGLVYNFFNIGKMQQGAYDLTVLGHSVSINRAFVSALLGILLAVAIIEGIVFIFQFIVKQRVFGSGDSFILGALGAVFGIYWVLPIFIMGVFLQAIAVFPSFIKKLFVHKEYALLKALGWFVASIIGLKLLEILGLVNDFFVFILAMIPVFVTGALASIRLIQSTKREDGIGLTVLPFGPPLIIAAWILLFIGFKPWTTMLLSVG